MFGYLRFTLAILVMFQHVGVPYMNIYPYNPGVFAVTCFYMLAGFVVTHLLHKLFQSGQSALLQFYAERLLRIFPMYIFMLLLCIGFLLITDYGNPVWSPMALINNLIIIPLNYDPMWDSGILQSPRYTLLPTAWSLGLELQAYLLLPLIVFNRIAKIILAVISLAVFFAADFGFIDTVMYGYSLLPGVFFIFILGSCIYKRTKLPHIADRFDKLFPLVCQILCIIGVLGLYLDNSLHRFYALEVLVGTLCSVYIITHCAKSLRKFALDKALGDLSYGIFLSQYLGIWLAYYLNPAWSINTIELFTFVLSFSIIASLAGVFLVEKRFIAIRYKLTSTAVK